MVCSLFYRDPDPVGLAVNTTHHGACVELDVRNLFGLVEGASLVTRQSMRMPRRDRPIASRRGILIDSLVTELEGTAIHFSGSLQGIFSQDQRALCLDIRVAFAGRSIENEHTAKLLAYGSHTRVP